MKGNLKQYWRPSPPQLHLEAGLREGSGKTHLLTEVSTNEAH